MISLLYLDLRGTSRHRRNQRIRQQTMYSHMTYSTRSKIDLDSGVKVQHTNKVSVRLKGFFGLTGIIDYVELVFYNFELFLIIINKII